MRRLVSGNGFRVVQILCRDFINPGGLLDKTEDMLGSILGSGKPGQKAIAPLPPPPPPLPLDRDAATDYQVSIQNCHCVLLLLGSVLCLRREERRTAILFYSLYEDGLVGLQQVQLAFAHAVPI